jgi:protein SCO1
MKVASRDTASPSGRKVGQAAALALALFVPVSALAAAERETADPSAPGVTAPDSEIISDGVDITEKLGERAAIDVPLVNHEGKIVRLRDYLGKRPVILALVYFRCPVLCGLLLQGLAKALQQLDWQAGKEYDLLTVSVDPNETSDLAREKRRGFLQALGRPEEERRQGGAWPFFTGSVEAIDFLAASVGFQFKYVARERQFAHIAALFVLAPDGKISRYLYGINFPPKDVKLALFEAGEGKVGTAFERVLLRCFKFDPASRRYHLFVRNYYRVWGVIILLALGTFLGVLWRRELRKQRTPAPDAMDDDKGNS